MTSNDSVPHTKNSQFNLLRSERFAPFFGTQFLGAFNDNLFKNALMIYIAFIVPQTLPAESGFLLNVAAGLFILPFFLFSAFAGQLADKYEKSKLIRIVKFSEVIIMTGAAFAFYHHQIGILLIMLFLMGTQSAFFGPVKYSLLPQHLHPRELVGGNALVEMGTFLAILLGTMAGAEIVALPSGTLWIGSMIVLVALMGWYTSCSIPDGPPSAPHLKINWNPLTQTIQTIRLAKNNKPVFHSILAISWFWFLGVIYLTQLPTYTRDVLNGNERVVTLLLALFSCGVGNGSLICERISGGKMELGLIPLGCLGLSIFGVDLHFTPHMESSSLLLGVVNLIQMPGALRVMIDFLGIGFFGGIFIVPLFAFIQLKTEPRYRARIIAANNIMNALFMVVAALVSVFLLNVIHLSIPQLFLTIALGNILVMLMSAYQVPVYLVRFLVGALTHTLYRVKHDRLDVIPEEGAAVLVSNHVSFIDAFLISGACRRPIRFVIYAPIYHSPCLNWFFRLVNTIPIDGKHKDPETYRAAFEQIESALENDELVCIFPEGKLTRDGEIDFFKPGIEKIVHKSPVPVIPLALKGLWGSFFSHKGGKAMHRLPRRFWSRITLRAGGPLMPESVTAKGLWDTVRQLRGNDA